MNIKLASFICRR